MLSFFQKKNTFWLSEIKRLCQGEKKTLTSKWFPFLVLWQLHDWLGSIHWILFWCAFFIYSSSSGHVPQAFAAPLIQHHVGMSVSVFPQLQQLQVKQSRTRTEAYPFYVCCFLQRSCWLRKINQNTLKSWEVWQSTRKLKPKHIRLVPTAERICAKNHLLLCLIAWEGCPLRHLAGAREQTDKKRCESSIKEGGTPKQTPPMWASAGILVTTRL